MTQDTQPVALPEQPSLWQRWRDHLPGDVGVSLWEFAILIIVSAWFLFYGLVPFFGGAQIGLVGADEPRYAQIAREMLAAHSEECHEVHARITPHSLRAKDLHASYECLVGGTVTPILYGRPWLEKPALYYWRAMSFFKEFGVSDWSARYLRPQARARSSSSRFCIFDDSVPEAISTRHSSWSRWPAWWAFPAARPLTCNSPRRYR